MNRLATIDLLRGISISVVIYIHFSMAWSQSWSDSMYHIWAYLDFLAAPMFVMVSCIGKIYSVNKQDGLITPQTITRSSFLLIIGAFIWVFECFSMNRWILPCNLLFFMGLMQVITPCLMRLNGLACLFLASMIYVFYFPLSSVEVIRYLLMDTTLMNPYLPWLLIPLLVIAIRKFLFLGKVESQKVVYFAIGLIIIALVTSTFNTSSLISVFARSYPQYILFSLGIDLILFSFVIKYESRIETRFKKIVNFGRLSLTGYVLSGLGFTIPIGLSMLLFHAIFPIILLLLIQVLHVITTRYNEKFTMEWILLQYSRLLVHLNGVHGGEGNWHKLDWNTDWNNMEWVTLEF